MKKNLFYPFAFLLALTFSGFAFQSCDDDDDDGPIIQAEGKKAIELRIVDQDGLLSTADVMIKKNGTAYKTQTVAGAYSLDVSDDTNNDVFSFVATRSGYFDSDEESVTLLYSNSTDNFSAYIVLQITKKNLPFVINPNEDYILYLPSTTDTTRQVKITIPAGSTGDVFAHLSSTVIPTMASRGVISPDAPNNSPALQIINFESDWLADFMNGKQAKFEFPLSDQLINLLTESGLTLTFGTNSSGGWEEYPLVIDPVNKVGIVYTSHFSRWYLNAGFRIDVAYSQSEFEVLGTSECGTPLTVTYIKENPPIPTFYKKLFNWNDEIPSLNISYTATSSNGYYAVIRARSVQVNIISAGLNIPSYAFYKAPVTFSATQIACEHTGGGGN